MAPLLALVGTPFQAEVSMAGPRRFRRYSPWLPLALALAGVGVLLGVLLLPPAPQARGDTPAPRAAAGFQTTEHLAVTVNLSPAGAPARGTLRVELVGPRGQVLADAARDLPAEAGAAGLRFQFRLPQ